MIKEEKVFAKVQDYGYREYKWLNKFYKIFTTCLVCLIIAMLYLSIIVILIQSFNSSTIVSKFQSFTFKWYTSMFSKRSLRAAIGNTIFISLTATIISTILGTLVAIGIHHLNPKKQSRVLLLNNIPLLNADIVTGISLMLIFSLLLPIFPYIFGWKTMLIAHMFFTLPYVILSVLPKLRELDPNMMDAALDLGLKPRQALIKVIVPSIRSGIFAGMLLAFTMSFDDFVISYYMTGNGFENLSIWIHSSIGRKSLTPSVYAFSTLVTFISMSFLLIVNFLIGRKKVRNAK